MKNKLLFLFLISFSGMLSAQTDSSEFNSMRTPLSPAFTVLGVEPTAVEKPNTPSSMAFSFYNNFASGTLPKNFSMEFAPYWLTPRPKLTWQQDTTRTFCQSVVRTSTLSFATGKYQFEKDTVTGLSFGYRTQLCSGHISPEALNALNALQKKCEADARSFISFQNDSNSIKQFKQEVSEANGDPVKLSAALKSYQERKKISDSLAFVQYLESKSADNGLSDSLTKLATKRTGFILEFAVAGVAASRNDSWKTMHLPKYAMWLTPAFTSEKISFVSTFRYVYNTFNPDSTKNQVYGGLRFMYTKDRYSISAEGMIRYQGQKITDDDYRVALVFDYRVFSNTWIQAAFGKNFTLPNGSNLLANIGLSYNISHDRYKLTE